MNSIGKLPNEELKTHGSKNPQKTGSLKGVTLLTRNMVRGSALSLRSGPRPRLAPTKYFVFRKIIAN